MSRKTLTTLGEEDKEDGSAEFSGLRSAATSFGADGAVLRERWGNCL